MIHALVQIQVEEFETFWLYFQTRDFHIRQAYGALGSQLFRHPDNPRLVTILFQWESRSQMERFFQEGATAWAAHGAHAVCSVEPPAHDKAVANAQAWHPLLFLQKAGELEA